MRVNGFDLVFDEVLRAHGFANVMKHGADAHEQRVGPNLLRRVLGKIGNLQAVLIAARCGAQQLQQQWMIRPRKLHQLQRGGDVKHVAEQEQPKQRDRCRDQSVSQAGTQ